MRAKRGEQSAFSLFPFLAVLLCAMGALVVLLVAIAEVTRKQATHEAEVAQAAADAAAAEQADSADRLADVQQGLDRLEDLEQKLATLKAEGQRRVKEEQEKLSGVEDHIRRLRQEADALRAEADELFRVEKQQGVDLEAARAELARLTGLVDESIEELEDLRHAAAGRERKFAVVPLRDRTSGTVRPPIYYECTADGVTIQPEGITFSWEDLIAPQFGNPVGAAERASARFYSENPGARAANEAGRPYPLLIIRPDGVRSYYAARSALEEAGVDYGYQPVGADWPIEYGDPNPLLYSWVADAVATAKAERLALGKINPQLASAMATADRLGRAELGDGFLPTGSDTPGAEGQGGWRISRADPNSTNPFRGLRVTAAHGGQTGGAQQADESAVHPGDSDSDPNATPQAGTASMVAHAVEGPALGGPAPGTGGAESQQPADGDAAEGPDATPQGYPSTAGSPAGAVASAANDGSAASAGSGTASGAVGASSGAAIRSGAAAQEETTQQAFSATIPTNQRPSDGDPTADAARRAGRRGVPVVRPIRLLVGADSVTLLSDDADRSLGVVAMPGPTPQHLNELLQTLEKHADSWGIAGPGMYWDPRLSIRTAGDGSARAAELVELLKAAGLNAQAPDARAATNPGASDATRR